MPKSDTIEAILSLNPSAKPDFLAEFSNADLHDYLHRLTFGPREIALADSRQSKRPVRFEQGKQAPQMRS